MHDAEIKNKVLLIFYSLESKRHVLFFLFCFSRVTSTKLNMTQNIQRCIKKNTLS